MNTIQVKIAGYTRTLEAREQLHELARQGILLPTDPVFVPEMRRWAHAQEVPELSVLLEEGRRHTQARLAAAASPWGRVRHVLSSILGVVWRKL